MRNVTYYNDDVEIEVGETLYKVWVDAEAEMEVQAEWVGADGAGDPGCVDFTIIDFKSGWRDEDGNEVEPTEEMESYLYDYLCYDTDMDEWV